MPNASRPSPAASQPGTSTTPPAPITRLLQAAGAGEPGAADALVARLYGELHLLARSRLRHSGHLTLLDTTALVHESWLRLQGGLQAAAGTPGEAGGDGSGPRFADRQHFLAYAARAMHSVVVDLVRSRRAGRHGGDAEHVTLDTAIADSLDGGAGAQVLQVHEALEQLARLDPRLARVVEMRYFGGLSDAEVAEALGVAERTVQRDWHKARLLLAQWLR